VALPRSNPEHQQGRTHSWNDLIGPLDESLTIAADRIRMALEAIDDATSQLVDAEETARIIGMAPIQVMCKTLLVSVRTSRDSISRAENRVRDSVRIMDFRFRGVPMGLPARTGASTQPPAATTCTYCRAALDDVRVTLPGQDVAFCTLACAQDYRKAQRP